MKPCPRCDADIGDSAVACRCGWKERGKTAKKDEFRQFMQCAHMGCNTSADVRLKTPTGWADFCRRHYDDFIQDRADAHCAKLGLHTVEQKKAWLRDNKLTIKKVPITREPGEDLDEVAA